jgi:hypothetical protein
MTIQYEITCDKCGGEVIQYSRQPKIEYKKISMSDYINSKKHGNMSHAVHYFTFYKLICTDCGHIEEYKL